MASNEEKLRAFKEFDFDGNQAWQEYFLKIDISGVDYARKLLKLKAKWYKREIDQDFDVASVMPGDATSTTAQKNESPGPETQSSTSQTSSSQPRASAVPPRASTMSPMSSLLMFLAHFALLILGAVSFLPLRVRTLHRTFLQLAILVHMSKVFIQFGTPTFRPFSALKEWASRALPSTDFQYACMSLVFIPRMPTRFVVIPSTVLAAYHVASYLGTNFGSSALWTRFGQRIHAQMAERKYQALLMNAGAEVMVGLMMIAQFLTPERNILVAFIYWQWLRTRYFSPDAAAYHRQVWYTIGQKVSPILVRVPILNMPINLAKKWFLNVGGSHRG